MGRDEFLRLFKNNEEAFRIMYALACNKEKDQFVRCSNFISINREDYTIRANHGTAAIPKEFIHNNYNIKKA